MIKLLLTCILSCTLGQSWPVNEKILNPNRTNQQDRPNQVPQLHLNKESFTKLESAYFYHSVGGEAISEATMVSMRYNDEFLEINFECLDNPRMDQNYYFEHNQPLFEQEVFELFINQGANAKERYLEVQINPNNAIFVARVTNRFKTDQRFHLEMLDNEIAQIHHEVIKDQKNNSWKGYLKIPLKLIDDPEEKEKGMYRMNLFRIISKKDQLDPTWQNNAKNAIFACWNSPQTKKPNFHKPAAFGILYLSN